MMFGTRFYAMGSHWNAWLETPEDGETILAQVPGWVETLEACLSRFRPESELSQLNARSGEWVRVSPTLREAVIQAKHAARLTEGLVTPLVLPALVAAGYERSFEQIGSGATLGGTAVLEGPVPDWRGIEIQPDAIRLPIGAQIDLGGTGKGWSAARIADRLAAYGPCLVDAGGDLVARGAPASQDGWLVDVAEPGLNNESTLLSITLADAAVATSGTDFRQWHKNGIARHHIIDPRSGQPAVTDVRSVTVIHTDAVMAESYAKVIILMGSLAGLEWINQQWQRAALVVRDDGAVLATSDFELSRR